MWCSTCQQDVPGVASPDDATRICCARCSGRLTPQAADAGQHELHGETPHARDAAQQDPKTREPSVEFELEPLAPLELDSIQLANWELDEDLRAVERVVSRFGDGPQGARRFREDATVARADAYAQAARHAQRSESPREHAATPRSSLAAWALLSVGVMLFVFGSVLLAWSFFAGRSDLWSFGMPVTLTGQTIVILGLVLQLEGLWQSSRATSKTLSELDGQLDELRHTTSLISNSHSNSARSFYSHMAEGASPHMLLADLKGQLDMLAMRMSRRG